MDAASTALTARKLAILRWTALEVEWSLGRSRGRARGSSLSAAVQARSFQFGQYLLADVQSGTFSRKLLCLPRDERREVHARDPLSGILGILSDGKIEHLDEGVLPLKLSHRRE